ncbi:hypothetical protein AXG93_2015s1440 [Marchantia polymorpha subsp. ruderalis]|uniref:Dirigent protein n=1 Tax=Marchantia polymorpha subsp. ruderalis TaxID=1480154 RepID=A0A176W4M4_MARPO|nr:hypothetical protein AXG93_2015s1440 [Marchantia polymorpha subsp. ruderalis]
MELKAVKFSYYLHDDLVPPNVTAVLVAGAGGSLTGQSSLGNIIVFDSFLRKTSSNASALIGHGSGEIVTLNDPVERFITFVHDITISGYSGTISASGRFNFTAPSWELGINSGTGSFRGARGYFTASMISLNPSFPILNRLADLFLRLGSVGAIGFSSVGIVVA